MESCREGYLPEQVCDRTILKCPIVLDKSQSLDFIIATNFECECIPLSNLYLSFMAKIPCFYLDIPYETNEYTLEYVYKQLKELIEYAEKNIPGAKYSEEKLIELQQIEKEWYLGYRELYEIKKRKPAVMSGEEVFKEPRWPSLYSDPRAYLNAFKEYVAEIKALAAEGKGIVEKEKLRILWAISGPFYSRPTPWDLLEKRGVTTVYYQIGNASRTSGNNPKIGIYGEDREYGRILGDPLKEEAAMMNQSAWGGLADRWIEDMLITCKDLSVDAIVYFRQWGCTVTENQGRLVADAAEKALGIPTALVDGRMLVSDAFNQENLENDLNNFIDACLERKGIK